ncbi:hypothetical protein DUI87_29691 [Hirundo rustica rustica]|uniref:Nuclear receptor subfamily 1 group I member 3 n=1 Tax=Hirundo rustica rustica TaxID=333673 RepID=A0A3M0IZD0_HIRRU|nr:hypothetical protein DUI87_29691 [Hirundo rustica rustica]
MSCEGCKGFFRRSVIKGVRFTCPLARRCPVTKAKRRQCQACRLQKCLDVGMRRDNQPHDVQTIPKDLLTVPMMSPLSPRCPDRPQRCPGCPHAYPDCPHGHPACPRVSPALSARCPQPAVRLFVPSPPGAAGTAELSLSPSLSPREEALPDALSLLPQFADLSTFMIQQVIKFAKEIPVFRSLPLDAQISLLKGATLGICQIRFNTVFNADTKAWECGQRCYNTIRDGALAGFQQIYLEPLLKFHQSLRRLRLHEAEYALLQAMLLFSPDHAGIAQREVIDQFQEEWR